jgi:hypothetical protein
MDDTEQQSESLLPYDVWTEDALRLVAVRALSHVAREGLPGKHHFFVSFRTRAPGVVIPPRLLAQYPEEMTIILQHQFWDLKVDESPSGPGPSFSVGLSFGGIPTTLTIPFSALTQFADPSVPFGHRFTTTPVPEPPPEPPPPPPAPELEPQQVVSLDAFRRRAPQKDQDPS